MNSEKYIEVAALLALNVILPIYFNVNNGLQNQIIKFFMRLDNILPSFEECQGNWYEPSTKMLSFHTNKARKQKLKHGVLKSKYRDEMKNMHVFSKIQ